MTRINFFSGDDARCLIEGKVSEVVVSDDMTIVFNNDKFWYKYKGEWIDCDVPSSHIKEKDYDAIAKDIRVNSIIPYIDFGGNVVSLMKVDATTLYALMSGKMEKYDISLGVRQDCQHATVYRNYGELFFDDGGFVVRVFNTDYEFEIGMNINEHLIEIFPLTLAVAADWDEYLSLDAYIGCAWEQNKFNFEITDIDGNTWYSCNRDADGNRLPIMDWYIGKKDSDLRVAIGDVRSSYYALINEGGIVDKMVGKMFLKHCGVE